MPARRPATYDDLVALPEHVVGELIARELHVSPRAVAGNIYSPRHRRTCPAIVSHS
jgi:hypothetical protein